MIPSKGASSLEVEVLKVAHFGLTGVYNMVSNAFLIFLIGAWIQGTEVTENFLYVE